jgi:hypothetical protein
VETLPAVAGNVVEVVPAGTMTELAASCSNALLVDSKTSVPPAGAAPFNVTVHVVDAPEFKLFGLQVVWETAMICPKAPLEINRPVTPVIMTLKPVMKSSHNDLPNELRRLYPVGSSRFADQQAYCPWAILRVNMESVLSYQLIN